MHRYASPLALAMLFLTSALSANASINDFNTWTLVEDPDHANFTASIDSPSQLTLTAGDGEVAAGVDIGYQSVNGATASGSTQGYAFDPAQDFALSVAFNFDFGAGPDVGELAIGFGIGEDAGGENSAGVTVYTKDGSLAAVPITGAYFGAARVNDATQSPLPLTDLSDMNGRFFVSYDAASGSVTVGVADSPSATVADSSTTFAAIQPSWPGGFLLASMFLRSDGVLGQNWQSGGADAAFSDLRVDEGAAVLLVPEPTSLVLLAGTGLAAIRRRRATR